MRNGGNGGVVLKHEACTRIVMVALSLGAVDAAEIRSLSWLPHWTRESGVIFELETDVIGDLGARLGVPVVRDSTTSPCQG